MKGGGMFIDFGKTTFRFCEHHRTNYSSIINWIVRWMAYKFNK